jgi:hypothetical protein
MCAWGFMGMLTPKVICASTKMKLDCTRHRIKLEALFIGKN